MTHLVAPLKGVDLYAARQQLVHAHTFLVARSVDALATAPVAVQLWGATMKRKHVNLGASDRPNVVGKDSERFVEVVNMVATLERLIDALRFFDERQQEFGSLRVKECHPSTSSTKDSNDLVLEDSNGAVVVRCEVSDIASLSASSNGKESKDVASLGCANGVPQDGVRRFLCTSPEFAEAIRRPSRKWKQIHFRYSEFAVDATSGTVVLELMSRTAFGAGR